MIETLSDGIGLMFFRSSLLLAGFWIACGLLGANPRARVMLSRTITIALVLLPFLGLLSIPRVLSLPIPARNLIEGAPSSQRASSVSGEVELVRDPSAPFRSLNLAEFRDQNPESPIGSSSNRPFRILYVLLGIWITGALLLFARWMVSILFLRRISAASQPPPEWVYDAKARLCEHLGVRTAVLLGLVDDLRSALLLGPHPTILLPRHVLEGEVSEDIYSVLAHELVHVLKRDWYWSQAIRLVCSFLWPLPWVWFVRRAHDSATELICDHVAAMSVGGTDSYSGSLARQSLYATGHSYLAAMPMLRASGIRRRMDLLLSGSNLPALSSRASATTAFLCLILAGALCAIRLAGAETPISSAVPSFITVEGNVRTADSHPLAPEEWKASLREGSSKFITPEQTGDHFIARGVDADSDVELFVTAFGYHTWRSGTIKDAMLQHLPDIVLSPAPLTTVHGTLVDGNGKPIEGATLRLTLTNSSFEYPQDPSKRVVTDSQGRFEFKDAPVGGPFILQSRYANSGKLSYIEGPSKKNATDYFSTWDPKGGDLALGTVKGISLQGSDSRENKNQPFPRIDPFAVAVPPVGITAQPKAGIGAVMHSSSEGQICVSSVFPGAPADQSGVRAGDVILSIDGKKLNKPIGTEDFKTAIESIKGPKGSVVHLTVLRLGEATPLVFNITRVPFKRDGGSSRQLTDGETDAAIRQLPNPNLSDKQSVLDYIRSVSELTNQERGGSDFSPNSPQIEAFASLGPENLPQLLEAKKYFDSYYIQEAIKRLANDSNEALIISHLGDQPYLMEIILAHDWVTAAHQQVFDHLGEQADPMDAYGWIEAALELRDPKAYAGIKRAFAFTAHRYQIYQQLGNLTGFDLDGAVSASWDHEKQVQAATPSPLITPAVEIATAAAERGHLDALDYLVRIISTHQITQAAVECPLPEATLVKLTDAKGSPDEIVAWYNGHQKGLVWNAAKGRYMP